MKRLLALLLLVTLCCASVAALSLTFQNPSDFAEFVTCTGYGTPGTYSCGWTESSDGGNSYISTYSALSGGFVTGHSFMINKDPLQTTYAAATVIPGVGSPGVDIVLYDASFNILYEYQGGTPAVSSRYEMIMSGSTASIYSNKVLLDSSAPLSQNPTYVGFGSRNSASSAVWSIGWDNLVYGSTENKDIFGSPEQGFFLKYVIPNPAFSGFYYPNGTTPVSNFNMSTNWGKGTTDPETIVFMNFGDNVVVDSFVTSEMAGTKSWPIQDDIINNPLAKSGYYVTTIVGSGKYSDPILYTVGGATASWNQDTYSREDTGQFTYSIDAGGYWDPATYVYRMDTISVTTGQVVDTQTITTQTGFKNVKFETSDPLGVYYGVVIATPIAGGSDLWLVADTCSLTGYLSLFGVTLYAPNGTPINGANINISQGITVFNYTTGAFGNYSTTSAFLSGSITYINVTAPGCYQYTNSFTPLEAKSINLSYTLRIFNTPHTGVAIDGVDRDSTYGRPISGLQNHIYNTTYSESYYATGLPDGYFLLDESKGAYLTAGRLYFLEGVGSGYRKTGDQPYQVTAVG